MIAKVTVGQGFRRLAQYLERAKTENAANRVVWRAARNLPTDDPELAAEYMRASAAQSARVEKPVYHLSISFDPSDGPTPDRMQLAADRVLRDLGLHAHQALLVAHGDRAHAHVHIMINRVHPMTHRAWDRTDDYATIERSLRVLERELGLVRVNGRHSVSEQRRDFERPALRGRAGQPPLSLTARYVVARTVEFDRILQLDRMVRSSRALVERAEHRLGEARRVEKIMHEGERVYVSALARAYRDPRAAANAIDAFDHANGAAATHARLRQASTEFGVLRDADRPRMFGRFEWHGGVAADVGARAATLVSHREELARLKVAVARVGTETQARAALTTHVARYESLRARASLLPDRDTVAGQIARATSRLTDVERDALRAGMTGRQRAIVTVLGAAREASRPERSASRATARHELARAEGRRAASALLHLRSTDLVGLATSIDPFARVLGRRVHRAVRDAVLARD